MGLGTLLLLITHVVPSGDGGVEVWLEQKSALLEAHRASPPQERTATLRTFLDASWAFSSERCERERSPAVCDLALQDWFQGAQLGRAEGGPAPMRALSCEPKGLALRQCLVGLFGKGTLVSGSDAEFMYLVPLEKGVRLIIGTRHGTHLTLFSDERRTGARLRTVVEHASPAIEASSDGWVIAPFGSDRFLGSVDPDRGWLERESPMHGGFVLCHGGARIEPLGALMEASLRGVGYHPEETEQYLVFRYRAPCSGLVVGSTTRGLQVGRLPARAIEAQIDKRCDEGSCTLSMRLKGRVAQFTIRQGTERWNSGTLNPLGDLNRDGIMDYQLSWADPAGGSERLLVSTTSTWEAVAAMDYDQ
jgi:hypothetical protein